MRRSTATLIANTLTMLAVPAMAQVSHSFDSDSQGWLITDLVAAPGSGVAATWNGATHRIETTDVVDWTTFSAPAAMLGNLSPYAGGLLAFELRDDFKDNTADNTATLGSFGANSNVLMWFGGSPSTTVMTPFAATLGTADTRWRLNANPNDPGSGLAPTALDWAGVLGDVAAIRISADWLTGPDYSELDNVQLLAAVPEPQTWSLMVLGLAAVGAAARRRQP